MSKTPTFDAVLKEAPEDIWKASPIFPVPVAVVPEPQPNPGFFRLAGMLMKELVRR